MQSLLFYLLLKWDAEAGDGHLDVHLRDAALVDLELDSDLLRPLLHGPGQFGRQVKVAYHLRGNTFKMTGS